MLCYSRNLNNSYARVTIKHYEHLLPKNYDPVDACRAFVAESLTLSQTNFPHHSTTNKPFLLFEAIRVSYVSLQILL
jgi:hypothetical protein